MTVRIITDSNGRKHITNEPLLHQPAPVQSCYCPNCEAMGKELAALKAQPAPVQEPVAWEYTTSYVPNPDRDNGVRVTSELRVAQVNALPGSIKPLGYTTPPAAKRQWVGLTDDEILKLAYPIRWQEVDDFEADKAVNFAQAIEAKLKEKNT